MILVGDVLNRNNQTTIPVFHIARLRMNSDGQGITSLVGIAGCPNRCKYCINASWLQKTPRNITPQHLYELLKVDDLYFRITGGGVTFGGGEPLIWSDGILEFAKIVQGAWNINVETSLNVPWENVEKVLPYVKLFIVDAKDMNDEIYRIYTDCDGDQVRRNLERLVKFTPDHVLVRLPLIPGFNSVDDVKKSRQYLEELGVEQIDTFTYKEVRAEWNENASF